MMYTLPFGWCTIAACSRAVALRTRKQGRRIGARRAGARQSRVEAPWKVASKRSGTQRSAQLGAACGRKPSLLLLCVAAPQNNKGNQE
jgi:hypothetical protein